jgi:hypothetical protein
MDMTFSYITEAYQSIYEPAYLNEEFLSEEYDGIEDLTEDDFDDIAEETVYEVLEEGLEVDELDDIFEAVIMELNPYAPAGSQASRQYQKSTSSSKRGAERAAAMSAAKEKVKSSVKGAVKKVKTSALAAKGSAQKTTKGLKQQSHVGVAKYASKHNLVKGAGLKTQSSKGRGELRSAVAKHVGSRIKDKIKSAVGKVKQKAASAAVSGYAAARSAKQAASDVKNRVVQSVKNKAAVAKRGVKGAAGAAKAGAKSAVGKAARAVASGAGKVASKLGEEFDTYDIVLEYLCVEGYAETLEDAEWIMVNELDLETIDEIVEAFKQANLDKMKGQEAKHAKQAFKDHQKEPDFSSSARNRSMKMSGIRGSIERGEDPRADTYGGAQKKPVDHRAGYSKNPLNNPPRPVKKPGV